MNNRNQQLTQEYQAKYDEPSLIMIRYRCIKRLTPEKFLKTHCCQ